MKITLELVLWLIITSFVTGLSCESIGEIQPSYTITFMFPVYALNLFVLPFILGYIHGKKQ